MNEDLTTAVRLHVFQHAAATGRVLQPPAIAAALDVSVDDVHDALRQLAAAKVLILAPNGTNIWAANPFCAVPSGFRVEARGNNYSGICIWDALGVVAAIGATDAKIHASCGDCGDKIELTIQNGEPAAAHDVVHFAIPARNWWDNIGFT